jgi:2-hydroxychromene-2-carboxylate isomerase
MEFPETPGGADLALAALSWIKNNPVDFIQAAFEAYWVDNADLNNVEIVSTLLSRVNIETMNWNPAVGMQQLEDSLRNAEEAGIVEAPAFVLDGQIFIGREHLPWIRTILETVEI